MNKSLGIDRFDIEIIEELPELSTYNKNYYRIDPHYGDWYDFFGNDIMLLKQEDDEMYGTAFIGKLVDNKFVPAFMLSYDSYNNRNI